MIDLPKLHPETYRKVAPFVAFDIEIASPFPEDGEWWEAERTLGVSCVGLYLFPSNASEAFGPPPDADGVRPDRMSPQAVEDVVTLLWHYALERHYNVVSWNGAGFDWRVLEMECRRETMRSICREMALTHVDPAFQMLCERGFMCKLDRASVAMNGLGKTEGMSGALAPEMWRSGDPDQQQGVLDYVAQDAYITAELYANVVQAGILRWVNSKGGVSEWRPKVHFYGAGDGESRGRYRLLTVKEAAALPLPDTSWLDRPMERARFHEWAM